MTNRILLGLVTPGGAPPWAQPAHIPEMEMPWVPLLVSVCLGLQVRCLCLSVWDCAQGTLLFVGLLLLLWVPLLMFSQGNPTYQTPLVVSFSINASIATPHAPAAAGQAGIQTLARFPFYVAGDRRSQVQGPPLKGSPSPAPVVRQDSRN
jgi:Piezo non-specific cation channel, R-Ras-binding domain